MTDASPYHFRPATSADLPMLAEWLRTPEVVRWWGDPAEQLELLRGDLAEPRMTMEIVALGARPFAYAQHYEVHAWPQPHWAALPAGARAIDAFIGVPELLGVGNGKRFLCALATRLRAAGAPVVAIDPDVTNLRACRAYVGAGFRREREVDTPEGRVLLMRFAD